MKKYPLSNLLFLLSFLNLSATYAQDYDNDSFVGYWVEHVLFVADSCSIDSVIDLKIYGLTLDEILSDSVYISDIKEYGDSAAWHIEFKDDGTYAEYGSFSCRKIKYPIVGTWNYKDGQLATRSQTSPCFVGERSPLEDYYYPIQWISPTAFYQCGQEGPKQHIVIIYKKIPDGLIEP
ncbi:MAG: hypothetical protein ACI8ZM_000132 [Crocinitomix sp.]|jgi:hypothetical protein